MSDYKVSILIPVYNVSKHIERCAHSIFSQTFQDIEYVFVDDCTPDDSILKLKVVLEQYPHRKSSVHIISHKENKGISSARQTAFDKATGDYFLAMDSDDYIDPDMIELMYDKANKTDADMVFCDYFEETAVDVSKLISCDFVNNKVELIYDAVVNRSAYWNKLIRFDILRRNNIKTLAGIDYGDDLAVLIKVIYHSNKFEYIERPLYHYNCYNTSACTKSFRPKYIHDRLKMVSYIDNFFSSQVDTLLYQPALEMLKATRKIKILRLTQDVNNYMMIYPEINKKVFHLPLAFKNKLMLFFAAKGFRLTLKAYLKLLTTVLKLQSKFLS